MENNNNIYNNNNNNREKNNNFNKINSPTIQLKKKQINIVDQLLQEIKSNLQFKQNFNKKKVIFTASPPPG